MAFGLVAGPWQIAYGVDLEQISPSIESCAKSSVTERSVPNAKMDLAVRFCYFIASDLWEV